jgi:hypothetical protein
MKVKVQECVETIYELPDNHFKKYKIEIDKWSDCEIASEFKIFGKCLFQNRSFDEDPISWDTSFFNNETNKWEKV